MESLSCGFEGRALLFADDTDFVVDGLTRSQNLLKKWDGEDAVDNIGFIEPLLLSDTISSSFLGDQCLESNGDDSKDHSPSPASIANNDKCVAGNLFSVGNSVLSSPEPSMSAKRAKVGDSQSPVPTCQVYGCNKDLSSSKDYHKRHKVCDLHSKTAVVIVNGIRQRFCQQCSRFHILAEFDEGKRSCRKRLAGHNERRRKPQFNTYLGSTYFTTDASQSLFFSGVLSDGFFGLQCNEPTDHSRHLMVEEEPLAVDVKLSQSLPKSVLRFHGMGKQYPSKNCLNAPSSLLSFNVSSGFSCALSLLSARKQNSSSNSVAMSMPHSLISAGNHHANNLFTAQNSGTTIGGSSSENNGLNARATAALPQGTNMVNLLELSLHLHRVEHQKYYGQIKLENDNFGDSTTA